jgi:hypothetical protein
MVGDPNEDVTPVEKLALAVSLLNSAVRHLKDECEILALTQGRYARHEAIAEIEKRKKEVT